MRELALFAGAGGGILGGHLLGWRTVCAVEWDRYAASVLVARQNDGCLPPFPIWDDVRTFDGCPWRGRVDVVSGGFPCQDISVAGKGAGITGERSGLWGEMARIIREVGPRYCFVENAAVLNRRGLDRVLGDLAAMGFDAQWGVYSAEQAGAPHLRQRTWIVAYADRGFSDGEDQEVRAGRDELVAGGAAGQQPHPDADRRRLEEQRVQEHRVEQGALGDELDGLRAAGRREGTRISAGWWEVEPDVGRVADGVASRVDRLRCIGNGQVPAVVRLAWHAMVTTWAR
jgi:DNA (cytosine-5)-methyltransferase 1